MLLKKLGIKVVLRNIYLFLIMTKIKITDWLFRKDEPFQCMTQNSMLSKALKVQRLRKI